MRIAIVSTFPPIECGIGTYTSFLTDALRKNGKEVHIFSQQGAKGMSVHPVYSPDNHSIARDLFLISARISPDVVHIQHEFGLFGDQRGVQVMELVLRLKMSGVPTIVTLHTVNPEMNFEEEVILHNLCRECERTIVHENFQKKILLEKFPDIDPLAIEVIPHGVREVQRVPNARQALEISSDQKVLLLAGFFRKSKQFDRVVRLFPEIKKRVPNSLLLIAGKLRGIEASDYQKEFFNQINESPARASILVLRGQFPQNTFDTILSSADVMAFPYYAGAQSGVMAHSAAFGIPTITSELPSFKSWIEESGGGIWAASDETFIDGAVKLLSQDDFREKCKKSLANFIKPRRWSVVSKKHVHAYEKIIKVPYGEARYFNVPE